jgi:flavin-dependent thymidylate synthase
MNVNLISFTPDALTLLLRTKNTRLTNKDDDPSMWDEAKRIEHLEYMRDTIKSSWEFVDYTFEIEGVTRAFTHQLVRTRTGSYAQQAMRVVDARAQPVEEPPSIAADDLGHRIWRDAVKVALQSYGNMLDLKLPAQDARGILPTHITTSIMAKFNLRTLHEMAKLRLCTRTQGEYQDVFRQMRTHVITVHPWAEEFIEVHCAATGTCAFPRYGKKECPVYLPAMDNTAVREEARRIFWAVRHEAAPMAVAGKAM